MISDNERLKLIKLLLMKSKETDEAGKIERLVTIENIKFLLEN
jgi:hypothetical protein